MKVKAVVSFSGIISMAVNEVRDIKNKSVLNDLINAGYVEEVKSEKKENTDENK